MRIKQLLFILTVFCLIMVINTSKVRGMLIKPVYHGYPAYSIYPLDETRIHVTKHDVLMTIKADNNASFVHTLTIKNEDISTQQLDFIFPSLETNNLQVKANNQIIDYDSLELYNNYQLNYIHYSNINYEGITNSLKQSYYDDNRNIEQKTVDLYVLDEGKIYYSLTDNFITNRHFYIDNYQVIDFQNLNKKIYIIDINKTMEIKRRAEILKPTKTLSFRKALEELIMVNSNAHNESQITDYYNYLMKYRNFSESYTVIDEQYFSSKIDINLYHQEFNPQEEKKVTVSYDILPTKYPNHYYYSLIFAKGEDWYHENCEIDVTLKTNNKFKYVHDAYHSYEKDGNTYYFDNIINDVLSFNLYETANKPRDKNIFVFLIILITMGLKYLPYIIGIIILIIILIKFIRRNKKKTIS